MYLGLRISSKIKANVKFSKFTYFNKETGEEIGIGSPSDLMRAWELGQVDLLAFNNPWPVPEEPGDYQVRIYLDNTVVASAMFEVLPKVSSQPVFNLGKEVALFLYQLQSEITPPDGFETNEYYMVTGAVQSKLGHKDSIMATLKGNSVAISEVEQKIASIHGGK